MLEKKDTKKVVGRDKSLSNSIHKQPGKNSASLIILVAALGYFVDIYDLLLFGIVRVPSLRGIGVKESDIKDIGLLLLNAQMAGMLIGGIFWGVLGDRRGRLSVLYGSIFVYSLANILNGMVTDVTTYSILRFIAGFGLAGELGAGITLVSEIMPKETRGYGTMIVASVGVCGAVVAALVADLFSWQISYFVGGGLGLMLLVFRISAYESGMFANIKKNEISRGDFFKLFTSKERFLKYINTILIGVPLWFIVGILVTLAPEFGKALNVVGEVSAGKAILFTYLGLAIGDMSSGLLSQIYKSRKKSVFVFLTLCLISITLFLYSDGASSQLFYLITMFMGFSAGYWAVFVTIASEQFGTNLRSTVTTTVPNFVRGSVVPISAFYKFLENHLGMKYGALTEGFIILLIAFIALSYLKETHGKDLDYIENI